MSKITAGNYEYYKGLFQILWRCLFRDQSLNIPEDHRPLNVLSRMEKASKSNARKGLEMALNDCIQMIKDGPDYFRELDAELEQNGYPGTAKFIAEFNDTARKVLKRGRIKDEIEYYVIKEMLDDSTAEISDRERKELNELFATFEARKVR